MDFLERHKEYLKFVDERSKSIERSIMWDAISNEFLTEIVDGRPKLDTPRKQSYFLEFKSDPGFSFIDNLRWYAAKVIELIAKKLSGMLVNGELKYRMIFRKLGEYNIRAKYSLETHPLFGTAKCTQTNNLLIQWHNYLRMYPHFGGVLRVCLKLELVRVF